MLHLPKHIDARSCRVTVVPLVEAPRVDDGPESINTMLGLVFGFWAGFGGHVEEPAVSRIEVLHSCSQHEKWCMCDGYTDKPRASICAT